MPRDLRIGNSGPDVRAVQQALNLRKDPAAPRIDEDGAFGPNTDAAVRSFQDSNALDPDGRVGPLTRVALFPLAIACNFLGIYLVRITPEALFYQLTNGIVLLLGCELTRQGLVELFWR